MIGAKENVARETDIDSDADLLSDVKKRKTEDSKIGNEDSSIHEKDNDLENNTVSNFKGNLTESDLSEVNKEEFSREVPESTGNADPNIDETVTDREKENSNQNIVELKEEQVHSSDVKSVIKDNIEKSEQDQGLNNSLLEGTNISEESEHKEVMEISEKDIPENSKTEKDEEETKEQDISGSSENKEGFVEITADSNNEASSGVLGEEDVSGNAKNKDEDLEKIEKDITEDSNNEASSGVLGEADVGNAKNKDEDLEKIQKDITEDSKYEAVSDGLDTEGISIKSEINTGTEDQGKDIDDSVTYKASDGEASESNDNSNKLEEHQTVTVKQKSDETTNGVPHIQNSDSQSKEEDHGNEEKVSKAEKTVDNSTGECFSQNFFYMMKNLYTSYILI